MESKLTLYLATNLLNGKQYVGLTLFFDKRLISHKCAATNSQFHKAIKEYGFENFVFTHIADAFDLQAACDLERALIQQHNTLIPNGYNMTVGGQIGAFAGKKHSELTKQKIRKASLGRNETVKKRFAEAQVGKVRDAKFRARASEAMKEVWAKRKMAEMEAKNLLTVIQNKEFSHGE